MISPAPPRFAFRLRRFGGKKGGKARPFRANLFPVRPQRPSGCRHPRNPHNLKFLNGRSGKTPHFSAFSQHSPKQRAGFLRSFSFIRLRKFSDHPVILQSFLAHMDSGRCRNPCRPPQAGPAGHACTASADRTAPACLRAFPTAPLSAARHAHGSRSPAAAATPQGGTRGDRGKLFSPAGPGAAPRLLLPDPLPLPPSSRFPAFPHRGRRLAKRAENG